MSPIPISLQVVDVVPIVLQYERRITQDTLRLAIAQLHMARDYFAKHGGAQTEYYDSLTGRVCVFGALGAVFEPDFKRAFASVGFAAMVLSSVPAAYIEAASMELYGRTTLDVNDKLGANAVLAVYDHAIKVAESFVTKPE
jgi:hypothetical protein